MVRDVERDMDRDELLKELDAAKRRIAELEQGRTNCSGLEPRAFMSAVMDNPFCGLFAVDRDGRMIYCNEAFARIYNASIADFLGKTAHDVFPPDVAKKLHEEDQRVMQFQQESLQEQELLIQGKTRHFIEYKFPIKDCQGGTEALGAMVIDISDRVVAQQALEASESQFRDLLENVDMVSMQGYDKERRVRYWNRASEQLYGYTKNEAMGCQLEDLIIPDFMREGVIAGIADWHENGNAIPAGELPLLRKDGSTVHVYSSHVMQRHSTGEKWMYCIDVDLSEIKKTHDELVAAKEMAESASLAKSEFLANMSHEIRTPLNGLLGMLQLLNGTGLGEEQREFVLLAMQSSKRLTRLLSDILDLSRVEAGKLVLRAEPFDLASILSQTVELYQPTAMQSGIKLRLRMDPRLHRQLTGDAIRLQQVLINLIGNAFKFTYSGEIVLEAQLLEAADPDQQRMLFSIADTGIGIADDRLEDLFNPFTQVNSGYERTHQGAGLGLSICKQLVELMGGTLAMVSEPGKGTKVYFSITLERGRASCEVDFSSAGELMLDDDPLEVLLAEDDRVSRIAATRQMEKFGCRVTPVEDGRQAVAALSNHSFDVVMMDIQMPVMNGLEATKAIRAGEAGEDRREIPIFAMTAYAMVGDKQKFLEEGMDGYLSKPVDLGALRKALGKIRG